MVSLYFHIPFCRQKCDYCDFYSIPDLSAIGDYIFALKEEIALRKTDDLVDTIFFGGGTPSLLNESQFSEIAQFICENFNLSPNCEWSIEVNPESFTEKKAKIWREFGVNRLSFGVQSLCNNELKLCFRVHTAEMAMSVLESKILREFESINVDLIYGLPEQTLASFMASLSKICQNSVVNHISLYELTISENTKFERDLKKYNLPSEEEIEEIVQKSREYLKMQNFERYEVSNFAKPNKRCRHNERYWKAKKYLGFGCAAFSFDGVERVANFSDLQKYIELLKTGNLPIEFSEKLSSEALRLEYLMLNLRTAEGFSLEEFSRGFGSDIVAKNKRYFDDLQASGIMQISGDICKLTDIGLDMADGIVARIN